MSMSVNSRKHICFCFNCKLQPYIFDASFTILPLPPWNDFFLTQSSIVIDSYRIRLSSEQGNLSDMFVP